jgi:hypothetical protein
LPTECQVIFEPTLNSEYLINPYQRDPCFIIQLSAKT